MPSAVFFMRHRSIYIFQCKLKHIELFVLKFTLLGIRKIGFVYMTVWLQNW